MTSRPGWKSLAVAGALIVRSSETQPDHGDRISLDRALHAAHEKTLREEEHDQRRRDRQDGARRDHASRAAESARQLENADGERHQLALRQHYAWPQEVIPRRHGG